MIACEQVDALTMVTTYRHTAESIQTSVVHVHRNPWLSLDNSRPRLTEDAYHSLHNVPDPQFDSKSYKRSLDPSMP